MTFGPNGLGGWLKIISAAFREEGTDSRWTEIVVGVDGSEGSRRALRWAYEEAREHDAKLLMVTAWMVPAPPMAPHTARTHGKDHSTSLRQRDRL